MIEHVFIALCRIPGLKKKLWRAWYNFLARSQRAPEWTFMNYGYALAPSSEEPALALDPQDTMDRTGIQLYWHVAGAISLEGLTVLEVGSGRGGGASFIKRYLRPERMIGVDLSRHAVELSQKRHRIPGLEFHFGDAEHLPFDDRSMDVVINVESSHCYPSFATFLQEVKRVLRPGGHFLYADFRSPSVVDGLRRSFKESGLSVLRESDITSNVLAALEYDDPRKVALIQDKVPKPLRPAFSDFAAVKGSTMFTNFETRRLVYWSFVLQRPVE